MSVFQTTAKQEPAEVYTDLYANLSDLEEHINRTKDFKMYSSLVYNKDVINSNVLINCLAVTNKMFPLKGPFFPLIWSRMKDANAIFVGGYPDDKDESTLSAWTGSAYCSDNSKAVLPYSGFHKLICKCEYYTDYKINSIHKKLVSLQSEGIFLIPEVLSTYVGGNKFMDKLWEPFIWNFLRCASVMLPHVPMIFTTESAFEKFTSAVDGSFYRMMVLVGDGDIGKEEKPLKWVERVIKENTNKDFNFFSLSSKAV